MKQRTRIAAAIYARRSKEQKDVATEAKSVTRQIENAEAFAANQGWTVAKDHVYEDDGISGAEFENRPGLQRLLAALPRRQFQRLIVSEQKSIGRELIETLYIIKRLSEAGVEVFEYVHGQSLTPVDYREKMMSALQAGVDEGHQKQASERTEEAHLKRFKLGHVVGGRFFGYDIENKFAPGADPLTSRRTHAERRINEAEAAVVRRIFELYDSGLGLKRIAKQLSHEGALTPTPFQTKRDKEQGIPVRAGWCISTVRAVLTRELYHGVAVWFRTKKRNNWGKRAPHARPEAEWVCIPAERLRIIDEQLWQRVQLRRQEMEKSSLRLGAGRLCGRPPKTNVANLLAGIARCGVCGRGLVVEYSKNRKGSYAYYMCWGRRHKGSNCTNALRLRVEEMNESVLQAIEEHALTPEAVEQVVRLTERDDAAERQTALAREQKDLKKRIARLVAAVETGGDLMSLQAKLRELEARDSVIAEELRGLHPLPRLAPHVIEDRLDEWRRLLRQSTTQGRAVLQRVLNGRIVFTPDGATGYSFEAPTRYDKLFSGIVVPRPAFIPTGNVGAEHIGAEDTFEGDYGRLLERATAAAASGGKFTGNGWRALQDSNLRPPGS